MEGGSKSRLGRLLHRLRGDHHKFTLDKGISFTSSAMSETTGCGSTAEEDRDPPVTPATDCDAFPEQFTPNIDLRYGGQYMTPEQLPIFCDQLRHLVEVIRNIQAYAEITGEYPAELERRLEREARSVASLAAESSNARDVIARTRVQRRALLEHRRWLQEQLTKMKDSAITIYSEVRELESTVRLSDRKLYKSWETLKDSNDPDAFEPLMEETRNKQTALECLIRLIEGRRAANSKCSTPPQPLPPPMPKDTTEEPTAMSYTRKRHSGRGKRRRAEPRSVPLSSEPSAHAHAPPQQVTLYIQGSDTARRRSVPATPLDLPSGGSVRDILFFTTNT